MKKKLFIAALAMVGGCDHHFGIGALEPDAGVALSGQDADASLLANDAGAGVGLQGLTTWTGYIDGYQFPSGSNAIRLALSVDSNGRVTGMVVLGDGPPPPLATDPNVGYPPVSFLVANNNPLGNYWAEGFGYSIARGTSSPPRLQFTVENYELWSGWCALQLITWVGGDSGTCLPNWEGGRIDYANGDPPQCYLRNPTNQQDTVFDCGKYDLCITDRVCLCSATECVSDQMRGAEAAFDLVLANNIATGTVSGIVNDPANVHFTQDP
jgi:hypothetical protein